MSAFAQAIDDLFADPNFAVDAVYTLPDGEGVPCRIMLRRPDETVEFGGSKLVVGSVVVEVRPSEVAAPAKGGTFTVGDAVYTIRAVPKKPDPDRLIWRCEASS
ncbi:MAG: hypothetical protein AB7I59_04475 [Geminicoccaceae bacterium]